MIKAVCETVGEKSGFWAVLRLGCCFSWSEKSQVSWYRSDKTPEKSPISCGPGQCAQLTLLLSKGFGLNVLQKCLQPQLSCAAVVPISVFALRAV